MVYTHQAILREDIPPSWEMRDKEAMINLYYIKHIKLPAAQLAEKVNLG